MKTQALLRKEFEDYIINEEVKEAFNLFFQLFNESKDFKIEPYQKGDKRRVLFRINSSVLLKKLKGYTVPFTFITNQKSLKFYIGAKKYHNQIISDAIKNRFDIGDSFDKKKKFDIKTADDVNFLYKELFVKKLKLETPFQNSSEISILTIVNQDIESYNDEEIEVFKEGNKKTKFIRYYERNPRLRTQAIEIHGTICKACKFDFFKAYGVRGEGYIEIHHIVPLSKLLEETQINPETDLVPLCSNCHRMIHRDKDNVLTVEEVIELVNVYR